MKVTFNTQNKLNRQNTYTHLTYSYLLAYKKFHINLLKPTGYMMHQQV